MKTLHIEGRCWFQRTYGNTYHTVAIWVDGVHIATHRMPEGLKGAGATP